MENLTNNELIQRQEELLIWFRGYDIECNKCRRRELHIELQRIDAEAEINAEKLNAINDEIKKRNLSEN